MNLVELELDETLADFEVQDWIDNVFSVQYPNVKARIKKGCSGLCNKKNEWHYPSKGELPKEDTAEKETLYLLWFGLDDSDYITGVFSHGRFWCFDCGWFDVKEVVAWKEIVPPSLDKEKADDTD